MGVAKFHNQQPNLLTNYYSKIVEVVLTNLDPFLILIIFTYVKIHHIKH